MQSIDRWIGYVLSLFVGGSNILISELLTKTLNVSWFRQVFSLPNKELETEGPGDRRTRGQKDLETEGPGDC